MQSKQIYVEPTSVKMDSNILESLGRPITPQESSDLFVRIETDLVLKDRNEALRAPSYLCLVCGKGLSITTSLSGIRMHVQTHSGERPYPCKFCDKKLSGVRQLARHIKVKHEALSEGIVFDVEKGLVASKYKKKAIA